jgi:transcriptional regulator with XRE-family HTH domain
MTDAGPRLKTFGRMVAEARGGKTQTELASEVRAALEMRGVASRYDQSVIAKIEKGAVTNPTGELVEALAEVLNVNHAEMIGSIIVDKYLSETNRHIAAPLCHGVLTLEQLAQWEGRKDHGELWVVSERSYDQGIVDLKEAVGRILKEGGRVFFFEARAEQPKFETYFRVHQRDNKEPLWDRLVFVPLEPDQTPWLAASIALANPESEAKREGYIILHDDQGFPFLALRMHKTPAWRVVHELRDLKTERLLELEKEHGAKPTSEAS